MAMDELPRLISEANWNRQRLEPIVAPGSREEAQALEALDAARADEERELQDTQRDRSRRHQRYWHRKLR